MNSKKISLLIIFLLYPTSGYAYFDPGIGSYIIQLIIAFLVSCYFFITNPIKFITNFFKKNKDNKEIDKKDSK